MSAFTPRLYLSVAATMAWSEFKLRYAGSALGYFWSFCKPLMLFGVLYAVFAKALRFGEGLPFFPLQLLTGVVLWTFFIESTSAGLRLLVGRADLLRKVAFPSSTLPLSVVATALLTLVLNMVAIVIFVGSAGISPTIHWLWLPLLMGELVVVTMGMTLLLGSLFVRFRDIGQIWDVLSQVIFYATPIIYPLTMVPEDTRGYMLMNPIAQTIEQFKRILVLGENGSLAPDLTGTELLIPISIAIVILVLGIVVHRRTATRMVELL